MILDLEVLQRPVRLDLRLEPDVGRVIALNFQSLASHNPRASSAIEISAQACGASFRVREPDGTTHAAQNVAVLLYRIEKVIIVELQKRRPDLLFLHAAALDINGRAMLLAGDTGAGKSTTTWALLQDGAGYLSDELSPVSLDSMSVLPYPHALCVKQRPPAPYVLPAQTLDLGRTLHVPTSAMSCAVVTEPRPIGAVLLIRHDPRAAAPDIRELTAAEAAARLYVNALNALAHPDAGLPAVLKLSSEVPCLSLVTADLFSSAAQIRALSNRLRPC